MKRSGKNVLACRIRPEDMDLTRIDTKQMGAETHPQECVFITLREKNHVATGILSISVTQRKLVSIERVRL